MKSWWGSAIIIGVIGILASAIVIPGLAASQRAQNERMASTRLKTLSSAEADFRANDRDENGVHDFWTGDVSGLYSLNVNGRQLQLIDRALAEADSGPIHGLCWPRRPAQGYFFQALEADDSTEDESEKFYFQDTGGNRPMGDVHHLSKFGFSAHPESNSSGQYTFIVNENNTIFRHKEVGHVTRWPSDAGLKQIWSG